MHISNQYQNIILKFISINNYETIATLTLNRPQKSNALNLQMIKELIHALEQINTQQTCRVLLLMAKGNNFCAGADLLWFKECITNLQYDEVLAQMTLLNKMYKMLSEIPIPSICIAKGNIYGGGIGLVTCTDYTICDINTQFCLSETKLGLIPAIILPYLIQKISPQNIKRLVYTAQTFDAHKAKEYGICEILTTKDKIQELIKNEIKNIVSACPVAQKDFKKLYFTLKNQNFDNYEDITTQAITQKIMSNQFHTRLQKFLYKDKIPLQNNYELIEKWNIENE